MASTFKGNSTPVQKQLHYTHQQGRLLFAMPVSLCECVKSLDFVFDVYWDKQLHKTVITRRVRQNVVPEYSKRQWFEKVEVEFVDFSAVEIEAVLDVLASEVGR